nr:MAG TPA: hypothetical protein [Caudoviricetes sp.]
MVPWEVQRRTLYLPFVPGGGAAVMRHRFAAGTGTPHGSDMPAHF